MPQFPKPCNQSRRGRIPEKMTEPTTDDRELVSAVLAKTPGAFERLVCEYQGLCWHIIHRMVRHPEDTRDLCQETFIRVHRYLHQFRHQSALKSWIGQVAYSVALRHLQRHRIPLTELPTNADGSSMLEQVGDGFDLEAACMDAQAHGTLHAMIGDLPPLQRTLLTLYHLDELSIPEIATITGLAEGTIKSHLFRTRKQLRVLLEASLGVST